MTKLPSKPKFITSVFEDVFYFTNKDIGSTTTEGAREVIHAKSPNHSTSVLFPLQKFSL